MLSELTKSDTAGFSSTTTAGAGVDKGISIGDVLQMLRAHLGFIGLCSLLGLAAAAAYVRTEPPVYEATATVRIDPGIVGSLGLNDLVPASANGGGDTLPTEIAILKSSGVAIRTLNSLSPDQYLAFAGTGGEHSLIPEDSETLPPAQDRLIAFVQASTAVKQEDGTQLLDVSFHAKNPEVAAMMANHLVEAYALQNFSSRDHSVGQLQNWLSAQMKRLHEQVDTSQSKLAAFQQANQIIATSGSQNSITDRLGQLNERLTEAQAARISREAQLRAAMTGNPATLASLFPNPKLQELENEQGRLYAQYAQMATKFGAKYAPLLEMNKQLQLIDGEIAGSVQAIRSDLKQQYDAAAGTEALLQGQYDQQTKLAYAFNRNQAQYSELQAEVTSSRELYDTLQRKLQQAAVDTQLSSLETVLVDKARAPLAPIAPKKLLVTLSGLLLGLFAGIASAFVFEASSDRVRNADQVEAETGYPALATIPSSPEERKVAKKVGKALAEALPVTCRSPLSQSAEAYRLLRNALVPSVGGDLRTILFTSTQPGEGVTTVATNFAVSLAQTGARVLLVDADLRRPRLHEKFNVENGVGLGTYLSGDAALPSAKQPIKTLPNLSLVTSGKMPPLPSESLASEDFRSLRESWESSYDYVVCKSAPLLIASDSLALASWADSTVLVTRYAATNLAGLATATKMLTQARAKIAGFVLFGAPEASSAYADRAAYGEESYV